MKRFAKIILGILAALVIVLIVALVGINLYLQSGDVQQRIRLATEQALGTPIAVKRTMYTPWNGLTLSGLSLPDPTIPEANLVEAPKFSVQFQFFPLLGRRLVISTISLTSPHLTLRQTPDKKWVLAPPKIKLPPREKPAAPTETAPAIRPPAFSVELSNFYIYDASADIIDSKGARLAHIDGLSMDGRLTAGRRVDGSVWIENIDLGGQLYPNRLRASFSYEDELLSVTEVKCAIADGKMRAEFTIVTPKKGPPVFQLKSEIEAVSIPTLISEAHGDEAGTSGMLLGHLDLRGNPLDSSTLVGGGEVSLDSAQLRPFDALQQIGTFLRVDELQLLKLREAKMVFEVRDEKFWVKNLTLKSENLIITGKGPIKFNGKMNLEGRFQVNEKIQRELSMFIGDQFTPSPEPGYKEVAFNVTGRTSRPETNLLDKITGYHLGGSLGGLLKGLFRMPKAPAPPSESPAPGN